MKTLIPTVSFNPKTFFAINSLVLTLIFSCFTIDLVSQTTYIVSNLNDTGAGSLRQAIIDANTNLGNDIINFSVSGTLNPASQLPLITDGVDIDGTTAPGYVVGTPTFSIFYDGSGTLVASNTSNVTIQGLGLEETVNNFAATAIQFTNVSVGVVQNNLFTEKGEGILATGGDDLTVLNNHFVSSGKQNKYCINLSNIVAGASTNRLNVAGNTFTNCIQGLSITLMDAIQIDATSMASTEIHLPNGIFDGVTGTALRINNCGNITLDNLNLSNTTSFGGIGLDALNCNNLIVQNLTINDRARGMFFQNCTSPVIDNNNISNIAVSNFASVGIEVSGGEDAEVLDNTITEYGRSNNTYALRIDNVMANGSGERLIVNGTTFVGGGNAVFLKNMDALVIDNVLTATPGQGVHLPDADGRQGMYGTSIFLENIDNTTLDNFNLSYTGGTVLGQGLATNLCDNLLVQNLTINDRGRAILIQNCVTGVIQNNDVANVLVSNAASAGIEINGGQDLQILDNTITEYGRSNNTYALRIDGVSANGSGDRLVVNGTTFVGGGNAVFLKNMDALVVDNVLTATPGQGVHLPDGDGRQGMYGTNMFLDNIDNTTLDNFDLSYTGGTVSGQGLVTNLCDNLLVQNLTVNDRGRGMLIQSCVTGVIQNNDIENVLVSNVASAGIEINGGQDLQILDNTITEYGRLNNTYALRINNVSANGSGDRLVVNGITFVGGGNSVNLVNMDALVVDNVLTATPGQGVHLPDGDGRQGMYGINLFLDNIDNTTLDNFVLSYTGGTTAGIGLRTNNCDNLTIQNLTIDDRGTGIDCSNNTSSIIQNNDIDNVLLSNSAGNGININGGQDLQILDNTITQYGRFNNSYALRINNVSPNGSGDRIIVNGTTFVGGTNGVSLGSMDGVIVDNVLTATPGQGVHLPDGDGRQGMAGINLNLDNLDNVTLDNFDLSYTGGGISGSGVRALNSDNLVLQNLTINDRGSGIFVQNSASADLLGNVISGGNGNGIEVFLGNDILVQNNSVSNFTNINNTAAYKYRSIVDDGMGRLSALDNSFSNNFTGVRVESMDDMKISDGSLAGSEIILKAADNYASDVNGLQIVNCTNTQIENLTYKGTASPVSGIGIDLNNSTTSLIQGVSVSNKNIGISINRNQGHVIQQSLLQSNSIAINLSTANVVTNYTVSNNNFSCNNEAIRANVFAVVDAANNYWGRPDGSSSDSGSGDTYVLFGAPPNTGIINNSTTFLSSEDATTPITSPMANIQGNSMNIANGQTATSAGDNTEFGDVVDGNSLTKQFTIQNNGSDDMTISGITSSATQFMISGAPTTVAGNSSAAFDIVFIPDSQTSFSSTISVDQDDCYESPYTFVVEGQGIPNCMIEITNVATTDESCPDANDGTLTVTATCGSCANSGDIRYSIDGVDFTNTTGVFTGLADMTYTVTVRDANDINCTDTDSGIVGSGMDTTNPVAVCPTTSPVVSLDANGDGTLAANALAGGNSTDNCSVVETSSSVTYDCTDIGMQMVMLTATDGSGNTHTVMCDVTVEDEIAPVAICPTASPLVSLDVNGDGTLAVNALAGGNSTDNCSVVETSSSVTYDCNDIGTQMVMLTATDGSGSTHTVMCDVMVEDGIAPIISCNDITVDLGATGTYTLSSTDEAALISGSTDNCSMEANLSVVVTPSSFDCDDVAGTANNFALAFSEATPNPDYVESINNVGLSGNASRTLEFWVRMNETNVFNEHIINWGGTTQGTSFGFYQTNGSELVFYTFDSGLWDHETGFIFDTEQWYHIAASYDGPTQTVSVYINGQPAPNATYTFPGNINTTDGHLFLGVREDLASATFSTLDLDEIRIWDYARTQTEINADKNIGLNGNEAGLVLYYDMENNGPGTTVTVDKANGNNGTLINMDPNTDWVNSGSPVFSGGTSVVLEVTDVEGNTSTSTCAVTVTVNSNLSVTTTSTAETCQDGSDGQIEVAVTGGTAPYTFILTEQGTGNEIMMTGNSPQIFTNLVADDYIIEVQDNAGCSGTTTDNVAASTVLCCTIEITNVAITDEGCPDANDGMLTVTATCGSCANSTDIRYSIDGVDFTNTTGVFTGLADMTYTVTIRDVNDINCTDTDSGTVAPGMDTTNPVAVCPTTSPVVSLDGNGDGTLAADALAGGNSTDNCSVVETSGSVVYDCNDIGTQMVMLTATDGSGNTHTVMCDVTVEDAIAPVAMCPTTSPVVSLDGNGDGTLAADALAGGNSTDNCSAVETSGSVVYDCDDIGTQMVMLTATDGSGNTHTVMCDIIVEDAIVPVAMCPTTTPVVSLDGNGDGTLAADALAGGNSTDNCSVVETSGSVVYDCDDIGTQMVMLAATDGSGNTHTVMCDITVEDVTAPTIETVAMNMTVECDGSGNTTALQAWLDSYGGAVASDACASGATGNGSTSVLNFAGGAQKDYIEADATNLPSGPSSLITMEAVVKTSMNSGLGNILSIGQISNSQRFSMAVLNGNFSFFGQLNDGSSNTFIADDMWHHVAITYDGTIDELKYYVDGINVHTETRVLSPADAQKIYVSRRLETDSEYYEGDMAYARIWNSVRTDMEISSNQYAVLSNDPNLVAAYYFTDQGVPGGDNTSITSIVDISGSGNDGTPTNFDYLTNTSASTSNWVSPSGLTPLSGATSLVWTNDYTMLSDLCGETGSALITFTVTDGSGNSSTTSATFTIEDATDPTFTCPSAQTVNTNGSANCTANVPDLVSLVTDAMDNCGLSMNAITQDVTAGTEIMVTHGQVIMYTVTVIDDCGNDATCMISVTYEDDDNPVAVCPTTTPVVSLDGNGDGTLAADALAGGNSTDNCSVVETSASVAYDCDDIGTQMVMLTATDGSGNTNTVMCSVTVEDIIAPEVVCQDVTVQLDGNGEGTLTAAEVDNGSSDNCTSMLTYGLSETNYTCSDIDLGGGMPELAYSVNGVNDFFATNYTQTFVAEASGSLESIANLNVHTTISGQTFTATVELIEGNNPNGTNVLATGTLDVTDTPTVNTVTFDTPYTVTAGLGYALVITPPLGTPLSNGGTAAFVIKSAGDVHTGGSIWSSGFEFSFADLGFDAVLSGGGSSNTTILTVTDESGNSSTCESIVTVEDNIPPVAVCPTTTPVVSLDGNGDGTLAADALAGGNSTDNCSVVETSASVAYDCDDIGTQMVILTATDGSGNTNTVMCSVTVEDIIAPEVVCQDVTVQLDGNGEGTLTAAEVDNGSSDNCTSILTYGLSETNYTCSDIDLGGGMPELAYSVNGVNDFFATNYTQTFVAEASGSLESIANLNVHTTISGQTFTATVELIEGNNPNGTNVLATGTLDVTDTPTVNTVTFDTPYTVTAGLGYALVITPPPGTPLSNGGTAAFVIKSAGDVHTGGSIWSSGFEFSFADLGFDAVLSGGGSSNTTILTVTDEIGNSSTCESIVTVEDNIPPVAVCPTTTPVVSLDGNGDGTLAADALAGGNSTDNCSVVETSASVAYDCDDIGTQMVMLTATDGSGNTNTVMCSVTVEDIIAPEVVCQDVTVQLDGNGEGTLTAAEVDNGSSDNCTSMLTYGLSETNYTCSDIDLGGGMPELAYSVNGVNDFFATNYTQTFVAEASGSLESIANLNVHTTISGQTFTATVELIEGNNPNGTNVLATGTLDVTDTPTVNTVTFDTPYTVTAGLGYALVITPPLGTPLSNGGTAAFVIKSAGDVHTGGSIWSSGFEFSFADLGFDAVLSGGGSSNTTILTVTDQSGNSSTCESIVTVEDNIPPVAVCPTTTPVVSLDGNGDGTLAADALEGGNSTDNCSVVETSASVAYDCDDIGTQMVMLTATDGSGNVNTTMCSVTVEDIIAPVAVCSSTALVVSLDNNGNGALAADALAGGNSTDNCTVTESSPMTAFDCSDLGTQMVILTATDESGNTNTIACDVTVEDTTNPDISECPSNQILDNTESNCFVLAEWDVPSITDNCTIDAIEFAGSGVNIITVGNEAFGAFPVGTTEVTLTATDQSNNESTCTFSIIVNDIEAPIITNCPTSDFIVEIDEGLCTADVSYGIITASDNCSGVTFTAISGHGVSGDIFEAGTTTVSFLATDASGLTSTCEFVVTVNDMTPPELVCQDFITQLDSEGSASIELSDIYISSTDNCAVADGTESVDMTMFDCSHIGDNTVTVSVTDISGVVGSCQVTVTILDGISPTATCPETPVVVNLDESGNGILAADVIGGGSSTDNCDVIETNPMTTYSCSDLGSQTVILTATDGSGNTNTVMCSVTVADAIAPMAICQDVTVLLDTDGNGVISTSDVDLGSNDNCGINTLELDITSFDCTDASGASGQTVILTVTDDSGNASTCSATATIEDNTTPVAICPTQTIVVSLDANGDGTLAADALAEGNSTDNCMNVTESSAAVVYDCDDIGVQIVMLTATDNSGNTSTAMCNVTVEDVSMPVLNCISDVTVSTDSGCMANVDISATATDACGMPNLVYSPDLGTPFDLGTTNVTIIATDASGNTSDCSFDVTVQDTELPVAVCPTQTPVLELDVNGSAILAADALIAANSTDNCAISSETSPAMTYDCSHIGTQMVMLTATDNSSNTGTTMCAVTIEDNLSPDLVCPANVTVNTDAGSCMTSVNNVFLGMPSATDNCDAAISITNDVTSIAGAEFNGTFGTLTGCMQRDLQNAVSNYTYGNTCTPTCAINNCNNLQAAGRYAVVNQSTGTDAHDTGTLWNYFGHTTGTADDAFLAVNGSSVSAVFYSEVLSLDAGVNFDYGFWASSAFNQTVSQAAQLQARIIDVSSGNVVTSINSGLLTTIGWNETSSSFIPTTSGDYRFEILNISTQLIGNDFAIDDIFFIAADQTIFELGDNTVVWSVEDASGNVNTCEQTITVEDNEAPTAICDDIIVELDASGQATITADDVNNGSFDACSLASTSIDLTSFDIDDLGSNTVVLTVTDGSGNSATCEADVIVTAVAITYVWDDLDGDGRQEAGEPAIPGVTVNLLSNLNVVLQTTTTDSDGLAYFSNASFTNGQGFKLHYELPTGHAYTIMNFGSNENVDSDVFRTNGRTALLTYNELSPVVNQDCGMWSPGSIETYVWDDLDGDGRQEAGEPGIDGVTVELKDQLDNVVGVMTTANGGLVMFDNVAADVNHKLEYTLPTGHIFGQRNKGNENIDSDPSPTTGQTALFKLTKGNQFINNQDAAMHPPNSIIEAFVFDDLNGDSRQDAGDVAISNVTVRLLDAADAVVSTMTTNSSGIVSFSGLPARTIYKLEYDLPSTKHSFVLTNRGNDLIDSDVSRSTSRSANINTGYGTLTITHSDCGMWSPGSVEAFVWDDLNGNGVQDSGEPGLDGVSVDLTNGSGVVLESTTTSGGMAIFANVATNINHRLKVERPTDYGFTIVNQVDDFVDSDANRNSGFTPSFKLLQGAGTITNIDAGLWLPGTIQSFVWEDLNGNGLQDSGEPGIPNIEVGLFESNGVTLIETVFADVNGVATFNNVPANRFVRLKFVETSTFELTTRDAGTDDTIDSDANVLNGLTGSFKASQSTELFTKWDAGFIPTTSTAPLVIDEVEAEVIELDADDEESFDIDVNEIVNNEKLSKGVKLTAYPNPFFDRVNIEFELTESQRVNLAIFNTEGRLIKELNTQILNAGRHMIIWNAYEQNVDAGVYYLVLATDDQVIKKKLIHVE